MAKHRWEHKYFYGEDISTSEREQGYINYSTLAKAVDSMVLCNDLIPKTQAANIGYWETDNGFDYYYENLETGEQLDPLDYDSLSEEQKEREEWEERYFDIYQYYIISSRGAEILSDLTDEIVFYNEELDLYVWGITHFGTMWSGVNTSIKIVNGEND